MHFDLVDAVLERSGDRIVTLKHVSQAEEYLQDHFASFPVLPGVLMLEAMVQAARRLVDDRQRAGAPPLVLGRVRALKYGQFVAPGSSLRVEVALLKAGDDGIYEFKGEGVVVRPGPASSGAEPETAVSGRFTLRPLRLGPAATGPVGEPVNAR
jgi:3-hydroxyacyl-[acyl-carrier-protein] dehydratase